MESSVMTSASSHRLRSAASACARPTRSYLSSSYLGSSIECESLDSGGCLKKFNGPGTKNGEISFMGKLNVTKKQNSGNDYSISYKRHRLGGRVCSDHCFGFKNLQNPKNDNLNFDGASADDLLKAFPKRFVIGNDFLSKLKLNGKLIHPKRLAKYLSKTSAGNEGSRKKGEKVIVDKASRRSINNNNISSNNNTNKEGDGKADDKEKNKNGRKDIDVRFVNKNISISKKSESSVECSKCGVMHVDEKFRNEKQEISKWQPKHVLTRRTAQIVREIRKAWQTRVGSSKLVPVENVRLLLNDLQLFPSKSQVREMLECAKECPENSPTDYVNFGEVFTIVNSLTKCNKNFFAPQAISRIPKKNVEKRNKKFSKVMSKYDVFLGGSCNPTTWRTDFAIPELENMRISYYNPQVEEWRPDLVEIEYHAKENAKVMFFVLDNQTRGVSALVEVAHLAGNQRKLILVIQSYTEKNQMICDEKISQMEYEDLRNGQEVLQDLVERQGIPVFDNIGDALKCTEKIVRENLNVEHVRPSANVNRENSLDPRIVFDNLDVSNSGEIKMVDTCLAMKILMNRHVSSGELGILISKSGRDLSGTCLNDQQLDFNNFLYVLSELKRQHDVTVSRDDLNVSSSIIDIYLGGTVEDTSWKESIAIPLLKSNDITFFTPKLNEGKEKYSDFEATVMENSFILLFVITSTARSIASMAIAGYLIGKGANVVLCVQHLPEGAIIGRENLSENAVKDYNRGRMYLMDIAKRRGVPVFEDVRQTVEFAIEKCRSR